MLQTFDMSGRNNSTNKSNNHSQGLLYQIVHRADFYFYFYLVHQQHDNLRDCIGQRQYKVYKQYMDKSGLGQMKKFSYRITMLRRACYAARL